MTELSSTMAAPFSFCFGLIVGSFTNVVVFRLPQGKSVVRPRSACPACGAPIRVQDNIPILGYLLLMGRCRKCRVAISPRYPVIEFLGGILFLAAQLKYGLSLELLLRDWPFIAILLAVTFIDLEHRIIPDVLSLGGLVLGLATFWLSSRTSWGGCFLGAGLGFGLFYGLAWIYDVVAKKQGLGGGDIKLLAMIGAFLGPAGVVTTICFSSILGSVVGIGWGLAAKRRGDQNALMKLVIPYGPFLVIGALTYYFFSDWIWIRFMSGGYE
jgi:leader peptidase (prepilin peptidase) / N-methyltransferase